MQKITYFNYQNGVSNPTRTADVDRYPDTCPVCNYSLHVKPQIANLHNNILQVVFYCPRNECGRFFVAEYDYSVTMSSVLRNCYPKYFRSREFGDEIKTISPNFVEIFNQSAEAESKQLMQVAGAGYRKALEFLIKDFVIHHLKHDKEEINKKFLGNCIDEYIEDDRIKKVAKRAAWLGNDETHYVRKWGNKDINDLKALIETTVYWISHLIISEKIVEDMPG